MLFSKMFVNKRFRSLLLLALSIGIAFQLWTFFQGYQEDLLRVWKSAGQHALWRGANFSINQNGADFISFIHEHVPEDARVVLPATGFKAPPLMRTPLMQFYLFPREVINCSVGEDNCQANFSNAGSYVLVFDPDIFPGNQMEDASRLLLESNSLGIYLPAGAEPGAGTELRSFQSFAHIAIQAIAPALFLLLLTTLGTIALRRVLGSMHLLARGAIGYGLALGLFTVSVFLLSLIGAEFRTATLLGLVLTGLMCAAIYLVTRRYKNGDSISPPSSIDMWQALFIALGGLLMLTSVGKGFFFGDEMVLWGPKGYGIPEAGLSAGVSNWGTSTINYPLHNLILIGAFKQWFGELLPASKMMFPLYFLGLTLLSYEYLRSHISKHIAGLSVLAIASSPVVIAHAEVSYANLPYTFYFVAAILVGMKIDNKHALARNLALGILTSLLFTFGMWARPEGIVLSALGILFIVMMQWQQWASGQRRKLALSLATPYTLFVTLWLSTSGLIYTEELRAVSSFSEMFNQLIIGDIHLYELGSIISFFFTDAFFSFKDWGLIGFGLSLYIVAVYTKNRYALKTNLLISNGIIAVAAVIGLLYLSSFNASGSCDLSCYLTGGTHRFIMPALVALWLGLSACLFSTEVSLDNDTK